MSRLLQISIDSDMSRFLNQEVSRLNVKYGIRVTPRDILMTLLRQHSLRVVSEAEEEEAILWYYDNLKEHNEAASTTSSSERNSR